MWSQRKYELAGAVDQTRELFPKAWQAWIARNPFLVGWALLKLFRGGRGKAGSVIRGTRPRSKKWWIVGIIGIGVAGAIYWRRTRAGSISHAT